MKNVCHCFAKGNDPLLFFFFHLLAGEQTASISSKKTLYMQNNYLLMFLTQHIDYVHPTSIAEYYIKMFIVL